MLYTNNSPYPRKLSSYALTALDYDLNIIKRYTLSQTTIEII